MSQTLKPRMQAGDLPVMLPAPAGLETHRTAACCQLKRRTFFHFCLNTVHSLTSKPSESCSPSPLFPRDHHTMWVAELTEAPVTVLQQTLLDANSLSVFLSLGNSSLMNLGERSEPISPYKILNCCILAFSASIAARVQNMPSALPIR